MSTAHSEAVKAMQNDPELSRKVMTAESPAERAEILRSAGVTPPTHADVSAAHLALSDVAGAGSSTPQGVANMNASAASVAGVPS
jgi:hypothetical protein